MAGTKARVTLEEVRSGARHEIGLPCVIGRGGEANLKLGDSGVSHRHARIFEAGDGLWIEDLGSRNGVYVANKRIVGKHPLGPGDRIILGQTELSVRLQEMDVPEETVILHSLEQVAGREMDRERLALIHDVTADLAENRDVKELAGRAFARLEDVFRQDRSFLGLFQEDGTLEPVLVYPEGDAPLSRTILDRVFRDGKSLLLQDALSEKALREQESIVGLRIRCALCVPLIYHGRIQGVLYLDRHVPGAYTEDDLELLATIGFILGPLVENARLWSELNHRYSDALKTLRNTEARLIDMERSAAYVRLAQAMAHEIRNPIMGIGGLVRRMTASDSGSADPKKVEMIRGLVERIESVLAEVDFFVKMPKPKTMLVRVDDHIQAVLNAHASALKQKDQRIWLTTRTSQVAVPLDRDLFRKALSMIFTEVLPGLPQGTGVEISVESSGNYLEIVIGEVNREEGLQEIFDPDLSDRPWSLGLFLNIAHKIIADHGGKMLFQARGHSPFPLLLRLPMRGQLL